MTTTEITFDAVFQINVKLPVVVTKEEALEVLRQNYTGILRGVTINRPAISTSFKIPWYFVVARGYVDTVDFDNIQVTTYKEDRND